MTLKALPYVYKITNIHTNQFYIGSRCNKRAKHHSEDLGFKYFKRWHGDKCKMKE